MNQLDPLKSLPKAPKPKVDLKEAKTIECIPCTKAGQPSALFVDAVVLKEISAIMSPSGKEEIVAIPVYSCMICGAVPPQFLKNAIKGV